MSSDDAGNGSFGYRRVKVGNSRIPLSPGSARRGVPDSLKSVVPPSPSQEHSERDGELHLSNASTQSTKNASKFGTSEKTSSSTTQRKASRSGSCSASHDVFLGSQRSSSDKISPRRREVRLSRLPRAPLSPFTSPRPDADEPRVSLVETRITPVSIAMVHGSSPSIDSVYMEENTSSTSPSATPIWIQGSQNAEPMWDRVATEDASGSEFSSRLVHASRKLYGSNKQLITVSTGICKRYKLGTLVRTLTSSVEELEKRNTCLTELARSIMPTEASYEDMKRLMAAVAPCANAATYVVYGLRDAAQLHRNNSFMFKQVSKAITTVRVALQLNATCLRDAPSLLHPENAFQLVVAAHANVDASLKELYLNLGAQVAKPLVSLGFLMEAIAAARSTVSAVERLGFRIEYARLEVRSKNTLLHVFHALRLSMLTAAQFASTLKYVVQHVDSSSEDAILTTLKFTVESYCMTLKVATEGMTKDVITWLLAHLDGDVTRPLSTISEHIERCTTSVVDALALCYRLSDVLEADMSSKTVEPRSQDVVKATKVIADTVALLQQTNASRKQEKEIVLSSSRRSVKRMTREDVSQILRTSVYEPFQLLLDTPDNITYSKEGHIKSATLDKLVEKLTAPNFRDLKYLKTFLLTYRSFTKSEVFLNKLLQRLDSTLQSGSLQRNPTVVYETIQRSSIIENQQFPPILEDEQSSNASHVVCLRVLNVLRQWLESRYDEFTPALLKRLRVALATMDGSKYERYAHSLFSLLNRLEDEPREPLTLQAKVQLGIPWPLNSLSPSRLLFLYDEVEIARQLCILDHAVYSCIQAEELMNQSWSKPALQHRSPNVLRLIRRSTQLSLWSASVILWQPTLRERVRIMSKIIALAGHLRAMNNFNSLVALIAGLNTAAVYRLKETKQRLPRNAVTLFTELESLMSVEASYQRYRDALATCSPPCVPFMGTHLTDLTFFDNGNPDMIDGLINFGKREQIYTVISHFLQFQSTRYPIESVENIAGYIDELPFNDEKSLYDLSLLREPRST